MKDKDQNNVKEKKKQEKTKTMKEEEKVKTKENLSWISLKLRDATTSMKQEQNP